MKKRIIAAQKIFSLLTSFNLILQSVLGGLLFAPNFSFAQEVTPTPVEETIVTETLVTQVPAEPTVEPTSEPTAEPTAAEPTVEPIPSNSSGQAIEPTVEPTSEPTSAEPTAEPTGQILPEAASTDIPNIEVLPVPTPSPVVVEKECLAGQEIKDTVNEDWSIDTEKGLAETKEKVKLGVKYDFPLENKVSVTFKCLPKDEGLRTSLKIQQVKVSDLKLPEGVNPAGEYAYDITTGMQDGDFEYDVTLPKPEDKSVDVSYMEDINGELKAVDETKLNQEGVTVKASNIDHFSIWITTYSSITFSDPKTVYYQGDEVFAKAGNLDSDHYYRIKIDPPSGSMIPIGSCGKPNSSHELTATYSLPPDATISTNWYARIYNYGNDDSDCSGSGSEKDHKKFEVKVAVTPTPTAIPTPTLFISLLAPIPTLTPCFLDSDGANDEPGQKDLTQLCQDQTSADPIKVTWSWDDTSMSGSNTADACALFDTNSNGLADYAVCVTWEKEQQQIVGSPLRYSCGDTRADRCAGSTLLSAPSATCTLGSATNPWDSGNPDTGVYCTIPLSDVGGADKASPLDVCSYPSSQPNSDPSDCVLVSSNKGNLSVIKNVNPDAPNTNWDISVTGNSSFSDTLVGDDTTGIRAVVPGDYTITETAGANTNLADYEPSWSCNSDGTSSSGSGTTISSISVVKGAVVSCTFLNQLKNGTIIIHKDVQGPNGEDVTDISNNFTVQLDSGNSQTLTDNGTVTYNNVSSGTHTITEITIPGGYSLYGITPDLDAGTAGAQITVTAGQTTDVYIVNRQQLTTLKLVKTVVNNNGGTKQVSDFILKIDGDIVTSGVANPLTAGNYTASEVNLNGYNASVWGGDCNQDGTVSLALGQNKTCTITNDDQQAKVILVKHLPNDNGGTATTADFPVTLNGQPAVWGDNIVNAGAYTAAETTKDGYTASVWSNDCSANGLVTLLPGETKTCEVTNDDIQPKLTVTKIVDNKGVDNKLVSDFKLYVGTTEVFSGIQNGFNADTYTVSEDNLPGFTEAINEDCNSTGSVTLGVGDEKECTITNVRDTGNLIVYKSVDDSSNLTQWGFILDSGLTIFADNTGKVDFGQVSTIVTHNITEVSPNSDYYFDSVSGTDCQTGVIPGTATATVAKNGTTVCTFNNKINKGQITIVKDALPNSAQDFSYVTTGSDLTNFSLDDDGDNTNDLENTKTFTSLFPGSYSITEGVVGGWDISNISCVEDKTENSTINLLDRTVNLIVEPGENVTCTFTNTKQPKLTVTKIVTNDNGGAKVIADFPLFVDGNPVTSGIKNIFSAGAHTISETGDPGYTETIGGNCASDGTISLSPGDDLTCTITNNDNAPSLTLDKIVANDNGGTALESAWTLTADGGNAGILSGPGAAGATDVVSDASFKAGTYTLSESTGPAGYTASSWSCIKNGIPVALTSPSLTLGLGDIATCTITNDDIVGQIKIIKNTIGGDGTFDFTVAGPTGQTPSITTSGGTGDTEFLNVDAGVYSISETVPAGWDLTGSSCTSGTPSSFTVSNGGRVDCTFTNTKFGSIQGKKFGDNNNNGVRNGSEPYLNNWQINLYDDEWSFVKGMQTGDDFTEAGNVATGQYLFINLKPENYYVCEELETGWVQTEPTSGPQNPNDNTYCHQVTVNPGDRVESILFGNFDLGEIQGRKFNDLNGNGQEDSGEPVINGWTIRLYNSDWQTAAPEQTTHFIVDYGQGRYRFENLNLGTYYICEVLQDGWTQTDPGGSEGFANQSPNNSEEAPRCRQAIIDESGDFISGKLFGNVNYGSISGMKYEDRDGNGEQNEGDNGLEEWTIELKQGETVIGSTTTAIDGTYSFQDIIAGDYQVCEVEQGGWTRTQPSDSECQPVTVVAGEDISNVDFGNFLNGQIIACKYNDYAGNGQYESQDDQPLSNISFKLYQDVTLIDTKQTELDGCVTFENLTAGEYRIEEDYTDPDLNGYYSTDGTTAYENIVVISGYDNQEEPFVFLNTPYRTISGMKFNDLNGDGSKDAGEPGIEGWKIFIDYNNDGLLAGSEPWIETDNTGYYEFTGLVSGSYTVAEVQQTGWTQTKPVSGSYSVDVHTAVISENNDFGNFELGKIQGYKYSDENDNGSWDQDEKGIKDWEICIEKQSVSEKVCTKTNADGYYEFTGLAWGDYEISEEHQTGWTQTYPGGAGTHLVSVTSGTGLGEEVPRYDFGNAAPIELTLEKSNDKPVAHTGDVVTYTLSIGISGRALSSMTLIDNSPDGFVYQTGTATVVGGTVNSVEPTLTNSGKTLTWTWTAVPSSSTVTVTYQTKIDSGNQAASYTNYAYVYGSGSPTSTDSEIVDSVVRIDPNISPSAQAGGEVLGAATELPASGSSTWYLILALSLIGAGFVIKKYSQKIN